MEYEDMIDEEHKLMKNKKKIENKIKECQEWEFPNMIG